MVAKPPRRRGGGGGGVLNTFPLAVWVRFMFCQLWITFVREPSRLMGLWLDKCKTWAHAIGLSLQPAFLPFMQFAVVRGDKSSPLQQGVVFSQLRSRSRCCGHGGPGDDATVA